MTEEPAGSGTFVNPPSQGGTTLMHTRTWIAATATISALITATASATATAAEDNAAARPAATTDRATQIGRIAETATSEWSVAHGTANASGLIRPLEGKSAIDGELRNTGSECYSLVIQPMLGSFPGPITKLSTNCGPESVPVYHEYAGSPLVKVCRSSAAPGADCGPAQRLPAGWGPPQGYIYEASWLATQDSKAYCESQGEKGISESRWTAYVCHEEYRGGADIPLLFQVLYVKK
jgi:hypothetical protein